jgi:hypothetical protein
MPHRVEAEMDRPETVHRRLNPPFNRLETPANRFQTVFCCLKTVCHRQKAVPNRL